MKWKIVSPFLVLIVLFSIGMACNLPSQLLGSPSSGPEEVEEKIEATFQAQTQQAQSSQNQNGGSQNPTPSPYPGDSSTHSLRAGNTYRGVDGITLGAAQGSLDAPVKITLKKIEAPQTQASLGVEQVGSFYHLRAKESFRTKNNLPLFLAFPIPEEEAVDDLAVAMLGKEDEVYTLPENEEDYDEKLSDAWVFRTASVDQEDSLLVITFFSLPEEGRTFTVVRDESFSPSMSSQSQGPGLAKPDDQNQGPFFKAVCHPKAFENVNWKCTKRDREAASTLLENAYKEHLELGFKKPALYYSIRVVSSLPNDVPNTDTGAREYTFSIADCTWMSNRWGNGVIGKYLGVAGSVSFQACYNGKKVNWRGGEATSADFVENTIYHEYFHATQFAYAGFSSTHSGWSKEGMARASENSAQSMNRGPAGWHDLDVALAEGSQKYRAQDFWVFTGKNMNRGLDYLIPFLKQGADAATVDRVLENTYGNTYPSGLSDAYWAWAKHQAFESEPGGLCSLNEKAVQVQGNEHSLLTSNIRGPQNISVPPLQSKVIRYNLFRLSDSPSVKYQYTLRASPGANEAFSKFYYQVNAGTDHCLSRPDRAKQFAVEVPPSVEYTNAYALIGNGMHDLKADFQLSVTAHKYEISISNPADHSTMTQGESSNFRAAFTEDGASQGGAVIKWTVGSPLSQGGGVVGQGGSITLSSDQIGGPGTYDIYANHVGKPPREAIYDSVTINVQAAGAPSVNITHPNDGDVLQSTYYGGDYDYDSRNNLLFTARGNATSGDGDAISGSNLNWSYRCLDCTGSGSWISAGSGGSVDLKLRDAVCGPTGYQLKLEATDSYGNSAQDVIEISVNVTGC